MSSTRLRAGVERPGGALRAAAALGIAAGALLCAGPARADDKKVCSQAYVQAQALRRAHSFQKAAEQLRICAQPTCAAFIVKDCAAWLADVDSRMPGVVLEAKDSRGQIIPDVAVAMDGQELVRKLDGRSVEVDPGEHTFTFITGPGTKVEQRLTIVEGEKAQRVVVTIHTPESDTPVRPEPAQPVAPSTGNLTASSEATSSGFWTPLRVTGVTVGAAGIVGLGLGAVFEVLKSSAYHQQQTDCASATSCANYAQGQTDHSTAVNDHLIGQVGLIAGGVLLAAGVGLVAFGGHHAEPRSVATSWVVTPSFGTTGGGLSIGKGF